MDSAAAYSLLAPVYDLWRPLWARRIMGRAEVYMEQEILPRILTSETRILDLGSGTGVNLARLRRLGLPFGSYTGLDLAPAMLAKAQARLDSHTPASYCRGDARRLPFANESFDVVLSTWMLSNVWPPRPVLDEARRVLTRCGTLVFLFWSRPPFPMGLVAGLLAPLLLARFVKRRDLDCLGEHSVIHRFARGWGTSVVLTQHPKAGQRAQTARQGAGT
jgi:ubiquinone/menaquinone biosynthesis C-methylase UbiE